MKKDSLPIIILISGFVITALFLIARQVVASNASLPLSTPEAAGLLWQECDLPDPYSSWQQTEACFGYPLPAWDDAQGSKRAQRIDQWDLRLQIGADTYQTRHLGSVLFNEFFVLLKNQQPVSLMAGTFETYSPNYMLWNIGGKAAWEFAAPDSHAIIYDGVDLKRAYGLDQAYRPYEIGGKLLFIGQKDSQYFVVYDGKRLTPEFDHITIAYCCEAMLYSPQGRQGIYFFNGTRKGSSYLVSIRTKD